MAECAVRMKQSNVFNVVSQNRRITKIIMICSKVATESKTTSMTSKIGI